MKAYASYLVTVCLFIGTQSLAADERTAPISPTAEWQVNIIAGISRIASSHPLVKNNEGAEIGVLAALPWRIWIENGNLVTLRGQLTNYSNGIPLPTNNAIGQQNKLVNAAHSQLRLDWRQIYALWGIHWSVGLGLQIPIVSSIITPRGEFSFAEAKSLYPEVAIDIARIDRSTGFFLRFGIDQKLLSDALIIGVALELMALEAPRTEQRFALNLYVGARIW